MVDRGFHPLRVARVVAETDDARSFVLDVPPALASTFAYASGQYCTFRFEVDGEQHLRSYSMSSAPAVDGELQVTVKRVPGGVVSNWMHDHVTEGSIVDVTAPAGVFLLPEGEGDVVAFAGGSGITPVISILKTVLATTDRRVRLLYANRDDASIIFRAVLDELAGDRLEVVHHLDVTDGFVDAEVVRRTLDGTTDPEVLICGPAPFMEVVEQAVDLPAGRIHLERFTPTEVVLDEHEGEGTTSVTIELDRRTATADYRPGTTILQTARQLGMSPPFSCEAGNCATCMAKVVDGSAKMHVNDALTPDEVEEGWVLTCQAVPTSPTVHVVYE
jgi:3-ketosteroid 9alpha-monooxygenase subunit B